MKELSRYDRQQVNEMEREDLIELIEVLYTRVEGLNEEIGGQKCGFRD